MKFDQIFYKFEVKKIVLKIYSDIPLFFKSVEGLVTAEVGAVVSGRLEGD